MKRIRIIVDGDVQKVGFRDFVHRETFGRGISGYVKNLDTDEVEIIAEGSEEELQALIPRINIIQYPIAVRECRVSWQEATGEFKRFQIVRGDIQEETFERMDYAGAIMHQTLEVSKEILGISKENLGISKENLGISKENLGISKEILGISKEDLGISKEILGISKETIRLQNIAIDKQDQMLTLGNETKNEIVALRTDTGKYLNDEFKEIRMELVSIKDALAKAGIKV